MANDIETSDREFNELTTRLGLGQLPDMQDWDLMCADAARVTEFINVYDNSPLTKGQRFALMALILASLDDAYRSGRIDAVESAAVSRILIAEHELHAYHIDYWARSSKPKSFAISPLIRSIRNEINA